MFDLLRGWLYSFVMFMNNFFNSSIRESSSNLISFIWASCVAFGWIKILLIFKDMIEFVIRHVYWGLVLLHIYPDSEMSKKKDLRHLYGQTKVLYQRKSQSSKNSNNSKSSSKNDDSKNSSSQNMAAPKDKDKSKDNNKVTWAVVTGACSVLGEQYATQIAKKTFNLILIDQDYPNLEKMKL